MGVLIFPENHLYEPPPHPLIYWVELARHRFGPSHHFRKIAVSSDPLGEEHLLLGDRIPRLGLNGLRILLQLDRQKDDPGNHREIGDE